VRIPDICTRVEEAVCIAAILQSLTATLIELRQNNQSWRIYRSHHIVENKWRAMRYGIEGKLVDFGKEQEIPMSFLAIEIVELVEKQARALGCWEEVQYVEKILKEGTSADRQIQTYEKSLQDGTSHEEALQAVVDNLIQETMEGV
jgi:carboxylate-amine ligase